MFVAQNAYNDHAKDLPNVEHLFMKLHKLNLIPQTERTLIVMVDNAAMLDGPQAWEVLKMLLLLPGFDDHVIEAQLEVSKILERCSAATAQQCVQEEAQLLNDQFTLHCP